jgi:two-component system sensor histidine kinase ChiS
MMPGLDGYEVCRRIRQRWSANELPVIMVTAKNQVTDLVEGLEAGANDFLSKPYAKDELVARIERHLRIAKAHAAHGRFVPTDLLSALGRKGPEDLVAGDRVAGERTLLELDLRDDSLDATGRFDRIRKLTEVLFPKVAEHGGIIGGVTGDAILCLFGTGVEGLEAAVDIGTGGEAYPLALHRGTIAVGTVGTAVTMREVCVSPLVTQLRTIRELAHRYGASVLAGEPVLFGVDGDYPRRMVGRLRDGEGILGIYEILRDDLPGTKERRASAKTFEEGLTAFYGREFGAAAAVFDRIVKRDPDDGAAAQYRDRSADYLTVPPPPEWDGVEMTR